MLHLLPLRLLLRTFSVFVGLTLVGALYLGWFTSGNLRLEAALVLRWSPILSFVAVILTYGAWRWIGPVQLAIFPYLGGHWTGQVRFLDSTGQPDYRHVTLEVKHTLFGMLMLLDSQESTSKTLAVHAERDADFTKFKLYYVYVNHRKEGFAGGGQSYRGLAIIRFEPGAPPKLEGDYFTAANHTGTLHLTRRAATSWWKLWR